MQADESEIRLSSNFGVGIPSNDLHMNLGLRLRSDLGMQSPHTEITSLGQDLNATKVGSFTLADELGLSAITMQTNPPESDSRVVQSDRDDSSDDLGDYEEEQLLSDQDGQ